MGFESVRYCVDFQQIPERLCGIARSGDTVLIMGAGSIETTPYEFARRLQREFQDDKTEVKALA